MVTTRRATGILFVPPAFTGSRPAFGLLFDNTYFFTLHALSGGGNDAAE